MPAGLGRTKDAGGHPGVREEGAAGQPGAAGPMLGRLPRFPERPYRIVALVTLLAILLLVGTGGWVRLSESGLGCPTWPRCYGTDLAAHAAYHSLVEFTNRCLITVVAVLIALAGAGAALAPRRRPDLVILSALLAVGYLTEALVGGLTVLARLTPALVAAHMIVAMLLVAAATALHWRAARQPGPPQHAAARPLRMLARLILLALAAAILLGTIATGSGPDAGSPGVARFGLPFRDVAELHAVAAMFFVGLTAAAYFALRLARVGRPGLRAYAMLAAAVAGQAVVGYTQYLAGLPAALIEVHIVGAGILVIAAIRFSLVLDGGVTPAGEQTSQARRE